MFFKLEDKVRDLDAARTKLMQLKSSVRDRRATSYLRDHGRYTDSDGDDYGDEEGDGEAQSRSSQIVAKERKNAAILSRTLNEAKKSVEEANIKVVRTDHHNQELKIRLESSQGLPEQERQTTKDSKELDELRAQSNEIARLTMLVERH